MVVDLVIPAVISPSAPRTSTSFLWEYIQQRFIPISPRKILRPDILIRILDPLLQRRQMLPMFPMLVPKVPGVDRAEDQAGGHDTDGGVSLCLWFPECGAGVLNRESSPEICGGAVSRVEDI